MLLLVDPLPLLRHVLDTLMKSLPLLLVLPDFELKKDVLLLDVSECLNAAFLDLKLRVLPLNGGSHLFHLLLEDGYFILSIAELLV